MIHQISLNPFVCELQGYHDYKSGTHIATTFIKLNTELYCRKWGRGAPPVCDQDTRGGTFQVDVRHIINI